MKSSKSGELTGQDRQIALRLRRRLEKVTPVRRLVVYGSRARGTAEAGSDMDVFIEVSELDVCLRKKISEAAWEVGLDEGLVISTFVATTHALRASPLAANPILRAIESEGVVI